MKLKVPFIEKRWRGTVYRRKRTLMWTQKVKHPRKTLSQTQRMFEAIQTQAQMRLQTLKQQQPRIEGQLDVLILMLQPEAKPTSSARAHPHLRDSDPDMA